MGVHFARLYVQCRKSSLDVIPDPHNLRLDLRYISLRLVPEIHQHPGQYPEGTEQVGETYGEINVLDGGRSGSRSWFPGSHELGCSDHVVKALCAEAGFL